MIWIKEVVTDILVTAFIAAGIIYGAVWMWWVIMIYTGLILIARILVMAAGNPRQFLQKTQTGAPDWFHHLLYALNTGMLAYSGWWYAASGWLLIWVFSFMARQKVKAP